MGRISVVNEDWLLIEEDGGCANLVRISSIVHATGQSDDEVLELCLLSGDEITYELKGGFKQFANVVAGVFIKPSVDSDTFGRVPV